MLRDVLVGEVYLCSGQSNMALETYYTFSADTLKADNVYRASVPVWDNVPVLIVDGDAVVMRRDIDLRIAIEEMEAAGVSLLISQDFNSLNSGVFLLKNSNWTRSFLAEARAARPMLATGSFMPLKYENRAFFYLTNMWPQCGGVRRLDAFLAPHHRDEEKFRDGTLVVDRCLVNRHPMRATEWWRLFDSGAGYDEISDAFIVHCPGGNADSKRMAMDALLSMSEW